MNKGLAILASCPPLLASAAAIVALTKNDSPLLPLLGAAAAIAGLGFALAAKKAIDAEAAETKRVAGETKAALAAREASRGRLRGSLSAIAAALASSARSKASGDGFAKGIAALLEEDEGLSAGSNHDPESKRLGANRAEALASAAAAYWSKASAQEAAAIEAIEDAALILPLARRIVAAVPAKTEEATMALLERFEEARSLSAKAAEASSEAMRHLDGGEGSESFQAKAHRTKDAIEAQRSAVASIVGNNRENARKLQTMSKELESGIELIKGIEEITERSRLIAFNMAVEAARIGEKGRGFKVIVNELRSLNDRTAEFSRQVATLLGRYREYNASLVAGMAEHSERLSGEVLDVMGVAEGAVVSLIDSSTTTQGLSAKLAGLVVEVDRDLDHVLEALQFQDITRQMLEGAIHVMNDAERRLKSAAPLLGLFGPRDRKNELARLESMRRDLIAQAKTIDEKKALMEADN